MREKTTDIFMRKLHMDEIDYFKLKRKLQNDFFSYLKS